MRQVTESYLDDAAARGQSMLLALRGHRLREKAKAAFQPERAALLECMSNAYLARGMAIVHRLAGAIDSASRLEAKSEQFLADARLICGGAK